MKRRMENYSIKNSLLAMMVVALLLIAVNTMPVTGQEALQTIQNNSILNGGDASKDPLKEARDNWGYDAHR